MFSFGPVWLCSRNYGTFVMILCDNDAHNLSEHGFTVSNPIELFSLYGPADWIGLTSIVSFFPNAMYMSTMQLKQQQLAAVWWTKT